MFLESEEFYKLTNHPVHILDEEGELSQTALIPFCAFGGNLSAMGVKHEKIAQFPVCNSFRPKILIDQLCYEVDPNKYMKNFNFNDKISLILLIDFNEDRQISMGNMINDKTTEDTNLMILEKNEVKGEVFIGSIGRMIFITLN